jgi:exosome complex RNA-binding protein Csl4
MDRMSEIVKRLPDTKITVENNTVGGVLDKCPECKKPFTRHYGQQIYCDDKCSNKHRQRLFRKRHKKNNTDTL